jgi:D-amino-acid dehydrogenase
MSSRTLYDELISKNQIQCGWETRGLLFVFRTQAGMAHYASIDELLRSVFQRSAIRLDRDELVTLEPALNPESTAGGWLYDCDAHLRPDRLMAELRRVLTDRGVKILENIECRQFIGDSHQARAIQTDRGLFDADAFVLATGAWTPTLTAGLGCRLPIIPGKGYSITLPRPALCPNYPMIFEEDRVAVTPFVDGLRIGSTMEFAGYDAHLNPHRLRLLTNSAKAYLRDFAASVGEGWWGWRPMTPDGLPRIGPTPNFRNVVVAAGHGMLGVSMAPATGKLVAEWLSGITPHLDPSPYQIPSVAS